MGGFRQQFWLVVFGLVNIDVVLKYTLTNASNRIECPLRAQLSKGMSVSIGSEADSDNQFLGVCFGEIIADGYC